MPRRQPLNTTPVAALRRHPGPDALQQLAFGKRIGCRLVARRAGDTKVRHPLVQRPRPYVVVRDRAQVLDVHPGVAQRGAQMRACEPVYQGLVEGSMKRQQRGRADVPLKGTQRHGGLHPLALALDAAQRLPEADISLFDARSPQRDVSADPRTLALSLGSVQWLKRLDAWPQEGVAPILEVSVSQQPPSAPPMFAGLFGEPEVRISAREQAVPMLGAVLSYGQIVAPLQSAWLAAEAAEPQRLCTRFGTAVSAIKPLTQGVEIDAGIAEIRKAITTAKTASGDSGSGAGKVLTGRSQLALADALTSKASSLSNYALVLSYVVNAKPALPFAAASEAVSTTGSPWLPPWPHAREAGELPLLHGHGQACVASAAELFDQVLASLARRARLASNPPERPTMRTASLIAASVLALTLAACNDSKPTVTAEPDPAAIAATPVVKPLTSTTVGLFVVMPLPN